MTTEPRDEDPMTPQPGSENSMSYATRDDVRGKIEWEGGITEALDYGLTVDDMPEGDTELRDAWGKLAVAYEALAPLTQAVEQLLYTDAETGE